MRRMDFQTLGHNACLTIPAAFASVPCNALPEANAGSQQGEGTDAPMPSWESAWIDLGGEG